MTNRISSSVFSEAAESTAGVTRRSAMNIMTAVIATPIAALPAGVLAETAIDRTAWNKAVARYQHARREMDKANRLCSAAFDRFEALKPSIDAVSKRPLPWDYLDWRDIEFAYDTNKARKLIGTKDPAHSRCMAALDGIDKYREGVKRAKEACNLATFETLVGEAGDRFSEAERSMFNTPAPDLSALHFKLDEMFGRTAVEEDGGDFAPGWHVTVLEPVMADVHRLLKGGEA